MKGVKQYCLVHVTDVISIACLIQALFIRPSPIIIYMCCRHRSTANRILIQIILPVYCTLYQNLGHLFTFHQAVHQTAY